MTTARNNGSRRARHGIVAAVALAMALVCFLAALFRPAACAPSYLLAFVFWVGLPLGALALHMLHELVGGEWGTSIRPIMYAAEATLPLMALLFVPLAIGVRGVYPWADASRATMDSSTHYGEFLSPQFFVVRSALYFVVWITLGICLWALRGRYASGQSGAARAIRGISAIGLILFVLSATFAAIDWIMSLDPHWVSPIFGLSFIAGVVLLFLAFANVILHSFEPEPVEGVSIESRSRRDLAHLVLAFLMLWAYLAFSQYLIIWSANLPEEVSYYVRRASGGWRVVAWLLVLGHFLIPFLLLLSGDIKSRGRWVAAICLFIVGMRLVDVYWLAVPCLHRENLWPFVLDALMVVGIGAIWLVVFGSVLGVVWERRPAAVAMS